MSDVDTSSDDGRYFTDIETSPDTPTAVDRDRPPQLKPCLCRWRCPCSLNCPCRGTMDSGREVLLDRIAANDVVEDFQLYDDGNVHHNGEGYHDGDDHHHEGYHDGDDSDGTETVIDDCHQQCSLATSVSESSSSSSESMEVEPGSGLQSLMASVTFGNAASHDSEELNGAGAHFQVSDPGLDEDIITFAGNAPGFLALTPVPHMSYCPLTPFIAEDLHKLKM